MNWIKILFKKIYENICRSGKIMMHQKAKAWMGKKKYNRVIKKIKNK